jgi:hypothetical protein
MHLPEPRGELTEILRETLQGPGGEPPGALLTSAAATGARSADALTDEDLQLALHLLYELHYRGFDGVDERWEWSPDLLRVRAVLEEPFTRELLSRFQPPPVHPLSAGAVARTLFDLTGGSGGPSIARFIARDADEQQVREMCVLRSAYQLKEADPHTWVIPRLHGAAKSALVEIQADEYGGGRPGAMHSELFAATMRAVGLEDTYGVYIDHVPALTLAAVNVMHLFGLHRRWRGAALGHLAAYEMTSSAPCRQYAIGIRRLGLGDEAAGFFDEHVEADAVHEQLAAFDLCGNLVAAEPRLAGDVLFGAVTLLGIDELAGAAVLNAWRQGRSPLRLPVPSTGTDRARSTPLAQ